ncbi:hypothetical protein EW146_g2883 [Bondarzewia mesenterica]|uniref:Uncharacterized protein n=1 Tax=Bondarzewia mesenterica TaxID=1095465 RepID=A0A4S4LZH4_9AGAM|nr:hypothetical protein EW146_g2883 [Bondarzewia mesenterica]
MNVRPDMIRPQGMSHMLNMNPPFQQQPGQQPQSQPQHMLMQNSNNINPGINFLPNGQTANAAPNRQTQLYQLQLQQANSQQRHQQLLQQSHNAQGMNGQTNGPSAPSHMNGVGPGQLQNVGFGGNMMQQPGPGVAVRRVASQPQMGGQPGGPMAGLHGTPQGMGGMGGLGMSVQGGMPSQLRQGPQQPPMNIRPPQPNQPQQMPSHISPAAPMGLNRPGHVQGIPGMPPNMAPGMVRSASGQPGMMSGVPQQSQLGQPHPGGMQAGFPQHGIQSQMPLPGQHAHQQAHINSSPRLSALSQNHTAATNLPMQGTVDRPRMPTENNMFMNFANAPFPQNMPHTTNRMPSGAPNQFGFGPSSTPPNQQHVDMAQGMAGGGGNLPSAPSPATRVDFQMTPAQQFASMQGGQSHGGEGYTHFGMPPPQQGGIAPPRPPSSQHPRPIGLSPQQPPPPQQQQHPGQPHPGPHLSPRHHQQDQVNGHMPHPARPQSQPQPQPGPLGRPPSQQAGHPRTPLTAAGSLPANATLLQGRPNISAHPPSQPQMSMAQPPRPPSAQSQPQPPLTAQGQLHMRPVAPPQGSGTPPENGVARGRPPAPVGPMMRPIPPVMPLGQGQGLLRLLQFSGILADEPSEIEPKKLQLKYWEEVVREYYVPAATLKLTLWKDNQTTEAKVFEVGTPILPRFFLVTSQSGVKSMTLSLDGAEERMTAHNSAVVECENAVWAYRYSNGYTVTLRGRLQAHILLIPVQLANGASAQASASHPNFMLKISNLIFDSQVYEKHVSFDVIVGQRIDTPKTPRTRNAQTPMVNGITTQPKEEDKWEEPKIVFERATIPSEPVNAFGIPQATMRCLELAESVGLMSDLIQFSTEKSLGPIDALKQYAQKIRESHVQNVVHGTNPAAGLPGSGQFNEVMNAVQAASCALYTSTPTSSNMPMPGPPGGPPPGPPLLQQPPQQQQQQPPQSQHHHQQPQHLQQPQQPPQPPPAGQPPTSSPGKPKGTPQQAHAPNPMAGSSSAAGPSTAPANPTSTPSMTNASLKRKAQNSDTASPTTANSGDQPPPAKRSARKRGRTTGGG